MSLLGDIVEHGTAEATLPELSEHSQKTGFPELRKFDIPKQPSRFKSKGSAKKPQPEVPEEPKAPAKESTSTSQSEPVSEAQRIHEENLKKIMQLSPDQFISERDELLQGLDPKLLEGLKKRAEKKDSKHVHAEGHDGWIGGGKNGVELPHLDTDEVNKALGIKSVKFDDKPVEHQIMESVESDEEHDGPEEEGDDEIAPDDYQIAPPEEHPPIEMHFPKPKVASEDPDMDINDPEFLDKLHEKYYPELPKETNKLAWMKDQGPQKRSTTYEAISDMRFDFKGNLIELDDSKADIPTHLGLHHHSADPHMAGYTLVELAHLARSVVPTQRSIAIQTIGRILHKLGLHKYDIMPLQDDGDGNPVAEEVATLMNEFELMMWDLIDQLRLTETLTEAADEKKTRNLSVRNYAIEALWLWKQGGGKPKDSRRTEEEVIAEQLQQM
ncbi:hypothetical protein FT663_02696 [Candidozyma haemuli var. vulneris]|uniref:RNA polymerase II-associated protein RBA50 n=1 Tax=Candidozyma haemuli TaxID=45357 RepID=A0A2V1AZM4_9ASCO|nr:hypothetical protein CXQ85_002547 [[Candida] haemuloni]KAF3987737.1 hypothetical protein FT662_03810 [[Candida] haemuloni var. vulneris]KAF3991510.1 hypothetical protein FT663_02696 [[Candida] haemuloni var. vulneris]PVH22823.1 hypothetical protein CXQ85_002547 [[Candida] haemuloni]